jgi:protein-L-isoaspartate(D-aspartate) O-methyltransferase
VLEIGTGCGYAAAVLARVFGKVISVERVKALHQLARERLRPLRIPNLHLLLGDGTAGVASDAPFDAIIAAAAGSEVPEAWIAQLKPGGRVVVPLGRDEQSLVVLDRGADGKVRRRQVEAVRFVPLRAGVV